jgi:hypothetical protein
MPFSVKHLFLPDDPMIARKFQENFDNIVSELNSFPISGAFKPGSIATTNITDDNITAAKFSSNLQFDQIPKGPAATDPSHADHLTRKSYAVTALSALITAPATGSKGAGAASFTSSTASLEEYEYFFNEFRWIYGYCKASDLYKTTALTTRAKMFHVMVVPIVGTATYQRVSVMPSTYATTGYIHIKSGVGGAGQTGSALVLSNFYGFFYMIVGRDI